MLDTALAGAAERIQSCLDTALAEAEPGPVTDGMAYATRGGKRLRGFLVLETARLHGVPAGQAAWAATSIETLHAYSLVHDDLRRGQPTVHVKWDEATAVLVGDALQTLAFACLARPDCAPDPARRIDLIASLARAAGIHGMVLGQAQDMEAGRAGRPLTLDEVIGLQRNKTGALIRWSAEAGPRLAGADPAALGAYAHALGLAFQIADDVLDVEGDAAETGKRVGKDEGAGKATFVGLLGLDGAKARAAALVDEAIAALAPYGHRAETLRQVARFVIARKS